MEMEWKALLSQDTAGKKSSLVACYTYKSRAPRKPNHRGRLQITIFNKCSMKSLYNLLLACDLCDFLPQNCDIFFGRIRFFFMIRLGGEPLLIHCRLLSCRRFEVGYMQVKLSVSETF